MTITEFLLARIAEDEVAARESERSYWNPSPDTRGRWHADWPQGSVSIMGSGKQALAYHCDPNAAAHMARHDPARVLAECAAKRAIVADHPDGAAAYKNPDGSYMRLFHGYCETCEIGHEAAPWPCTTLRALAAVYADHPDYEQGWAL